MNPASFFVIFVIVWWCAFFVVLPIGVRSRREAGEDDVAGADPGAPVSPQLRKKALWASAIALPVSLLISGIIISGVINFQR